MYRSFLAILSILATFTIVVILTFLYAPQGSAAVENLHEISSFHIWQNGEVCDYYASSACYGGSVEIDSSGNIYTSSGDGVNSSSSIIRKYSSSGAYVNNFITNNTWGGLTIDDSNNVYTANPYNIFKYDTQGSLVATIDGHVGPFSWNCNTSPIPYHSTLLGYNVRIGKDGFLYAPVYHWPECPTGGAPQVWLQKYTTAGDYVAEIDISAVNSAINGSRGGFDVDSAGNIYVLGDSKINKFNASGSAAGSTNLTAPVCSSSSAIDIRVDSNGNFYVIYPYGHPQGCIQKYNQSGNLLWEEGGANSASTYWGWYFDLDSVNSHIYTISVGSSDSYPANVVKLVLDYQVPTEIPTNTPTITNTSTPTATATSTVTPVATTTATPTPTLTSTVSITPSIGITNFPTGIVTMPPVTVLTTTPTNSVQADTCPAFDSFKVSTTVSEKGKPVTFSWVAVNSTRVIWSSIDNNLATTGSKTINPTEDITITLIADNGRCSAKVRASISVVETAPWSNSSAIGAGALVVEAAVVQVTSLFALATNGSSSTLQTGIQGNLWLSLAGFLDRKKRKSFGIVYNSVTKKPIARAIVRLINQKTEKVVDTVVTDAQGILRLIARPGEYKVQVSHPQFIFPSTLITSNVDGGYSQVYHGNLIKIDSTTQPIMISIPLDPQALTPLQQKKVAIMSFIEHIGIYGSTGLLAVGFLYSLYASIVYPHILNYISIGLYLFLLSAKLALVLVKQKTAGIVTTEDGTPLAGVEIGLFDTEYKTLLYRTFTSKEGKYSFAVNNGAYNLRVIDDRYAIIRAGQTQKMIAIEPIERRDKIRLITEDLLLQNQS